MSLILYQNTNNKMPIVTDDIITITSPVYLWRFVNCQTKVENLIELDNTTPEIERCDIFFLNLPVDLELEIGMYEYHVYQSDTPGDEDFEEMLELATGRADVKPTVAEITTYEPTGTDEVYQPQT